MHCPTSTIQKAYSEALKAWEVPPNLSGSEWADAHFQLAGAASEKGRWTCRPFQRKILDTMAAEYPTEVTIKKSARVGYTKMLCCDVAYHMAHDPADILIAQPTDDDAKDFMKDEIAPMIDAMPELSELVFRPQRRGKPTLSRVEYPGGILNTIGAHSARNFRRFTKDRGYADELAGWEATAGKEGDQLGLMRNRLISSSRPKFIKGSTPNMKANSRIDAEFEAGDQQHRYVPCPHCKGMQTLKFERFEWEKEDLPDGGHIHKPETVIYRCEHCGEGIEEGHKQWMDDHGEWIAHNPGAVDHASFYIWAAYSQEPGASWPNIVRAYLKAVEALKQGDTSRMQVFENTWRGLSYEPDEAGEQLDWAALYQRREPYSFGDIPDPRICYLQCTVDVQGDRFEAKIKGYAPGEESWNIDYHTITFAQSADDLTGENKRQSRLKAFDELEQWINTRAYRHPSGAMLKIEATAIDTGGLYYDDVCRWGSRAASTVSRLHLFKGANTQNAPARPNRPTKVKEHGVLLWVVGVHQAKNAVAARLQLVDEGPVIHFSEDFDQEYFEQLCNEQRVTRYVMGQAVDRWENPGRKRNEPWDLEGYHFCLFAITRPNLAVYAEKVAQAEPEQAAPVRKKKASMATW